MVHQNGGGPVRPVTSRRTQVALLVVIASALAGCANATHDVKYKIRREGHIITYHFRKDIFGRVLGEWGHWTTFDGREWDGVTPTESPKDLQNYFEANDEIISQTKTYSNSLRPRAIS